MNDLLSKNIYDVYGNTLICGTCLPNMQSVGYKKIESNYDTILGLCLEKNHINMAITKICGMLSTGKISALTFASVNRSPHCTSMHYIKHEIERMMDKTKIPPINNIIISDNEIHIIDDETIELSKDLVKLSLHH